MIQGNENRAAGSVVRRGRGPGRKSTIGRVGTYLRREIELPASMMRVSTVQRSAVKRKMKGEATSRPVSLGTTAYAENLRRDGDVLRPVNGPQVLATVSYRPVFTEERGGRTHIFTQSDAGVLRESVSIDAFGSATHVNRTVAELDRRVIEGARVGDFTVLRLADNTLFYLSYNSSTGLYTALGSLPEMPDLSVEEIEQPAVTATAAGMTFSKPVTDFRPGIDSAIADRLTASAADGIASAMRIASAGGLRTSPSAVRIGMRLWDGSMAALTAPQVVGDSVRGNIGTEVSFALRLGSNGYESASAATVSVSGYKILVKRKEGAVASTSWKGIVKQLEVWVSDCYDYRIGENGGDVYFRQITDGNNLTVKLNHRDTATMTEELVESGMRLCAVIPYDSEETEYSVGNVASGELSYPAKEVTERVPGRAAAMTSHDGFLHLGNTGRRLKSPEMPSPSAGSRKFAGAGRVEVDIRTRRGVLTVVSQTAMEGLDLRPLAWYGDSRAEEMRIYFQSPNGLGNMVRLPLTPVSGEDAACYAAADGVPLSLDRMSVPCQMPAAIAEAVWEDDPEHIVTCPRGNPFVAVSEMPSAGATVRALAAQPVGGGAFTRQFVYVFTETGVTVLNHDMNGHYTNMRSMSRIRVESSVQTASAKAGLYVLCDGELVLFKDSVERHLLRGLTEYERLMYDGSRDELWLCPAAGAGTSLVLDCGSFDDTAVDGSVRTVNPRLIFPSGVHPLVAETLGTIWNIYLPEGDLTPELSIRWESHPLHLELSGVGVIRLEAGGFPDAESEVRLTAVNPYSDSLDEETERETLIVKATQRQPAHGVREVPFLCPRPSVSPRDAVRYVVRVEGKIRYLRAVTMLERGRKVC